jgi:hypothetical protein
MKWCSLLKRLSKISQKGFIGLAHGLHESDKNTKICLNEFVIRVFLTKAREQIWDLLYNNKLRFGYQYLLLDQHSQLSKIKAFDTSLSQLGSQSILSKLKRLRFSALDSLSKQTQVFFTWLLLHM